MKYIILASVLLLSSCGVKDKIFKWNNSGELGVPKQNIESTDLVSNDSETKTSNISTTNVIETRYTEESNEVDGKTDYFFYLIPFVILGILAFLVFRLKKQNMNSL
jgi:hypothetical protein